MDDYFEILKDWHANAPAVCANDDASQIDWLKANSTAELKYYSLLDWNWDWGTAVLEWLLEQSDSDQSVVLLQFTNYVGSGSAAYGDTPENKMMQATADRLRKGFYRSRWGLERGRLSFDDYARELDRLPDRERWVVPSGLLVQPDKPVPPRPNIAFDGDGILRMTLEAWTSHQKKAS